MHCMDMAWRCTCLYWWHALTCIREETLGDYPYKTILCHALYDILLCLLLYIRFQVECMLQKVASCWLQS